MWLVCGYIMPMNTQTTALKYQHKHNSPILRRGPVVKNHPRHSCPPPRSHHHHNNRCGNPGGAVPLSQGAPGSSWKFDPPFAPYYTWVLSGGESCETDEDCSAVEGEVKKMRHIQASRSWLDVGVWPVIIALFAFENGLTSLSFLVSPAY
jgi:hypothetical protein